jgi:hypothetical protein
VSHTFLRPHIPPTGIAAVDTAIRIFLDWIMRGMMQGHINTDLEVTLTANQTTTVITDPRLSVHTVIGFCPLTANAAAEIGAGTLYVSARSSETATLTHANNAQTDRDFVLSLVG